MTLTERPIRVIDTETTGLEPAEHRIVEIGWQDVYFNRGTGKWTVDIFGGGSVLCDPGRDIPPEAKAVHHITESMTFGQPRAEHVLPMILVEGFNFAAHNAKFDMAFCGGAGWLCSMRLAMHMWAQAPKFGNQVLRYWRDLPVETVTNHRAKDDALVTAFVLADLLNEPLRRGAQYLGTFEDLVALANEPVVLKGVLGFGKYHDKTWAEVGTQHRDYLEWMLKQPEEDWDPDKYYTAKYYTGRLL